MGGFVVFQTSSSAEHSVALARAHEWSVERKQLPLQSKIVRPDVVLIKYGRRASSSADPAESAEGWVASIGFWSHPLCSQPNDNKRLLVLLKERGLSALRELDGMYVILWYEGSDRVLTVVTDHLGRLHTFVRAFDKGVLLSSSCVALARVVHSDPDTVGIVELLSSGTAYGQRTLFKQIHRVPAGSILQFKNGVLVNETQASHITFYGGGSYASSEDLLRVLTEHVDCLFSQYANPLSDLTGGLD